MSKFHNEETMYVDSITLLVKDIDKLLSFYTQNIGFELIEQKGDTYRLGVGNKILLNLVSNPEAELKGKITGLYHFAILLPNRKYLGQLINYYIKTNQRIVGGSDHAVSEALYLSDPEGNGIEIYADRDETKWEYQNDEVVMVTEAMDYEGLINDAYEEEWQGLPLGTVLGHVHFHVANLLKASNFFIDTLGFNQTLFYGGSAIFVSDQGYHHHIGLNTWNGVGAKNRTENMTGLMSYHLQVPSKAKKQFTEQLKDQGIVIYSDNNQNYIIDVNGVKVYF